VVERGIELFDRAARAWLLHSEQTVAPMVGGCPPSSRARRSFDVQSFPNRSGSAGIGIDVTEADRMRTRLAAMAEAHCARSTGGHRRRHLRGQSELAF